MRSEEVAEALTRAEQHLERGEGLAGSGFWKAVRAVKDSTALAGEFSSRIARIDAKAHDDWALLTIPLWVGSILAATGTGTLVWLVGQAYQWAEPWNTVAMVVGGFGLMTAVHSPAHLLVGRALGMRYSKWFIGSFQRPQPGVKIEYSSYLTTPPQYRAVMHAAGAVASKLALWLTFWAGFVAEIQLWGLVILGLGAVVTTITDFTIGFKSGDWKKARREWRFFRNAS